MHKNKVLVKISLFVFLLLSACGNGNSPDVTVTELSTNVISYDEIVRINNCGGKADSEQTLSRSFATTLEGGIELSAGYKSIAEGSISAKYSQYRNTTTSQRLIAPPGTNMEFVMRWSEDVRAGNVRVDGSSADYEVRIPVSVEQISSRDLGNCSENPESPIIQPTSPPSVQTEFPDIIVSANANNGVQFSVPESGNYKFTIKEGVYCTSSTLCRSIIRGYLNREIVWKDSYGLPHPMEQDYELGCWENQTANNDNCAVGLSVVIYLNAQQYIRWVIMEDKNSFFDNKGSVVLSVVKLP